MDIRKLLDESDKFDQSLFALRDLIEKIRPPLAKVRAISEDEYQADKAKLMAHFQKRIDELPLEFRGTAQQIVNSLWI